MTDTNKSNRQPAPRAPAGAQRARRPDGPIMMPTRDLSQLPTREVEQDARPKLSGIDAPFTVLVLLLLVIGLVALFSASYTDAYYRMGGNSYHYIIRQGIFATIGLAAMVFISRMNYHKFHYLAIPAMVGSALLLASRFFLSPIWVEHNDATRWINLGFTEFQPSEIAKLAVIVCFASMMSIYGTKKMHTFRYGIVPYGTDARGAVRTHLFAAALVGHCHHHRHRRGHDVHRRGQPVLAGAGRRNGRRRPGHPDADHGPLKRPAYRSGWTLMSIRASKGTRPSSLSWRSGRAASGASGWGRAGRNSSGCPKRPMTLSFRSGAKKWGLIGALLVIALFVALIMRGYYIAMRAGDKFGTLLAAGVTTQIALQTIFNLFVVTGLAPVTGASLPFFSYGGTSLMMLLAEVGIVLSVSRRIPAPRQG